LQPPRVTGGGFCDWSLAVITGMAFVTKMLEIAVNDCDAGRITPVQLISVFQEAIDNGDILEEENEFCVVVHVLPLINRGALRPSEHVSRFEERLDAKAAAVARQLREQEQRRPWWRFWR
jgi:hypothetical protein